MTVRDIPRPGRRQPVSSKAVRDLVADAPFPASACRVTQPDHAAARVPCAVPKLVIWPVSWGLVVGFRLLCGIR
jgi:hypothetical protein